MATAATPHRLSTVDHVMGMPIVVDVRDDVPVDTVDDVFAWFRDVDATFSTFRADSEICRIDRGELAAEDARSDVRDVLRRCEELRLETRGYFDAHAQGRLDPAGLVKGWSVDRAGELLESRGASTYAIFAGGDIRLRGAPGLGARWHVGIQHPLERHRVARVVEANGLAIATSGAYARGDHVLDPHTGDPATGLLSVTVAGPDLGTADAYATAAFAMGASGAEWTRELPARGYEAMTIRADRTVALTPGFPP